MITREKEKTKSENFKNSWHRVIIYYANIGVNFYTYNY